jgi:peptide/nickel transport system substrate-binding protein
VIHTDALRHPTRHRALALAGIVVATTLAVTGLTAASASAEPAKSAKASYATTINAGTSIALATINPFNSLYSTVNYEAYDALVRLGDAGKPESRLAKSWKTTNDLTWTFTLRKGVTFHDGTAFTAKDVAFTLDEIKKNNYSAVSLLGNVASYEATDDNTFTLTTTTPDPLLLTKLSQIYIVSQAAWTAKGDAYFASAEDGTGPYKVTSYTANSGLTFTAYKGFWGTKPATKTIKLTTFADQTALASAVQSGQIDVAHQLANTAIQTLKSDSSLSLYAKFGGNQNMFQFNTTTGPFAKLALRQAANLAINAPALIKAMTSGAGVEENGQLPMKGINGYTSSITRPSFNLTKAKAILKKNNAVGTKITITGLAAYSTLYQAVAAELDAAGFDTTVEAVDTLVWLKQFSAGTDADIFYRGLSYAGSKDADRAFSFVTFGAKPLVVDTKWNSLYAATKTELNTTKRTALLVKASKYLAKQSYILWTYGSPTVDATVKGVTGTNFGTGIVLSLDTIKKTK